MDWKLVSLNPLRRNNGKSMAKVEKWKMFEFIKLLDKHHEMILKGIMLERNLLNVFWHFFFFFSNTDDSLDARNEEKWKKLNGRDAV